MRLRRTLMTIITTITATKASTARSSHRSQFSRLRPISSMSRMSSGWCESSSQTLARAAVWKAAYVVTAVKKVQKEKSAME